MYTDIHVSCMQRFHKDAREFFAIREDLHYIIPRNDEM